MAARRLQIQMNYFYAIIGIYFLMLAADFIFSRNK